MCVYSIYALTPFSKRCQGLGPNIA
uniref:Uncharacterized protein n=1 Tax=Amphimedon queenslandica TaxID=400682 RepID=A0A1X7V0N1_AMPQE